MVDTRPFVDRRIGFVVLFSGSRASVDADRIKEMVNQNLEVTNLRVQVSRATGKDKPPQVKLITSESSLKSSSISTIESTIRNTLRDDMGMNIQTVEVIAAALTPSDKVRGATQV